MTAVLDTSILVRHFTHDDAVLGARASAYLASAGPKELLLTDVVAADTAIVLERYYRQPRPTITRALRSLIAAPQMSVPNAQVLSRAVDLYEAGASIVDALAVATAEGESCDLASFDRRITRGTRVRRIEP